jgi:molecular chaperone DnaK (HSP70)
VVVMRTPKGLGLEAYDTGAGRDVVKYLVEKNSELPARASRRFGTYEANQAHINVKICEERGEASDVPEENTLLHQTPIDLPMGLPACAPIEVTFSVDDAGVLHVFLTEQTTGQRWEIHLDSFSNPSDEDRLRLKPALANVA